MCFGPGTTYTSVQNLIVSHVCIQDSLVSEKNAPFIMLLESYIELYYHEVVLSVAVLLTVYIYMNKLDKERKFTLM